MADMGALWDAVLGDEPAPRAFTREAKEQAAAREASRALELRRARLIEKRSTLEAMPTVTLKDGAVARSHRIADGGSVVHAVAHRQWRAACGSASGRATSGWSTALDEQVSYPRCLSKIVR